jgi:lipopolysaccharide transport system ATP-binding protein
MSEPAIVAQNLCKTYKLYNRHIDRLKEALYPLGRKYHRLFYALKDVNFEAKKGEILGIVGRNGAGKSTLLSIISGVLTPSAGGVVTRGRISSLLELGTGFNPELTGVENIYFNGTIMGYSRQEMERRLDDILAFADIGDFIYQPLRTYSSGMKARLGFAVAVYVEPEILILDEVLAVGDELFRRKCYARMEEFFDAGKTVLYVSHSAETVNALCSRAILLDRGELILDGPPKLVTMYYKKFLFTDPRDTWKIRDEIIRLNKDGEQKREFAKSLEKAGGEVFTGTVEAASIEEETVRQKAFYIPNFESKSAVQTKNFEVDIYDMDIRTPEGQKVNALVMNEEYIYSFKVRFGVAFDHVNFGMGFKNEKGLAISWMIYPAMGRAMKKKFLEGQAYLINWHFKCFMLPGIYYADASIRDLAGGEKVILNKIVDGLAFRVIDLGDQQKGGIFDAGQRFSIKQL